MTDGRLVSEVRDPSYSSYFGDPLLGSAIVESPPSPRARALSVTLRPAMVDAS
jgi:hypothetical protein